MGSRFLFKGGKVVWEELILVAEGLNLVTKRRKGFNLCYDVMEWKMDRTRM